MRILIDIPEEVKHKVYAYGLSLSPSDKDQLIRAITNGIPLDKIKAEIDRLHYHPKLDFIKNDEVVEMALYIIDKYRGDGD